MLDILVLMALITAGCIAFHWAIGSPAFLPADEEDMHDE
jgi:hypothetical protein